MNWEKFIQAGIRLPLYMYASIEGLHERAIELIGWQPERWLVAGEEQLTTVYSDKHNQDTFAAFLKAKVLDSEANREAFVKVLQGADETLLAHCRIMQFTDYEAVSTEKLVADLNMFIDLFRDKFALYGIPKMVDDVVPEILNTHFSRPIDQETFLNAVVGRELSDYARERLSLLHIARQMQELGLEGLILQKTNADIIEKLGRFYPGIYHRIEGYVREFAWVTVSHHVQPMNLDNAIQAIRATLTDLSFNSEFHRLIESIISKHNESTIRFDAFFPTESDRSLLRFFRTLNHITESRKAAMSKALLMSYPLFVEIAERLESDVVSVRQLTAKELSAALERRGLTDEDRAHMANRLKTYVFCRENGSIAMLEGKEAQEYIRKTFAPVIEAKELRGAVASQGNAKGRVRVILLENQTEHLQTGEILVTSMTDPDMVPAMKRAAAIVTDEGGITCHAAIVSRELGKPCVIGTKIATKILKDGDLVEVDATRGIITKLPEPNTNASTSEQ